MLVAATAHYSGEAKAPRRQSGRKVKFIREDKGESGLGKSGREEGEN